MSIDWDTIEDAIIRWVYAGSGFDPDHAFWAQQKKPIPSGEYITARVRSIERTGQDWVETAENPLTFTDLVISAVSPSGNSLTSADHGRTTGDGPVRVASTGTEPGGLDPDTDYWVIAPDEDTLQLALSHVDARSGAEVDISTAGTGDITVVSTGDTRAQGAELEHRARGSRRLVLSLQCFGGSPDGQGIGVSGAAMVLDQVLSAVRLPTSADVLAAAGVGVLGFGPVLSIDGMVGMTSFEPRATLDCFLTIPSESTEPGTYIEFAELEDDSRTPPIVTWTPEDPGV